ncbi:MAG: cytochrome c biogenesis protein CcdA [Halobaculum sp.]
MSTGLVRRYRLPLTAGAVGAAAGLLAVSALPAFAGYVEHVLGVVGTAPGLDVRQPGVLFSLGAAALIGLSMNFLPCNLPIVMSLLPATTGADSRHGYLWRTTLYGVGAVLVLGTVGFALGALGGTLRPLVLAYPSAGAVLAVAVVGGVGALSVVWGVRELGLVTLPGLPVSVGRRLRETADTRDGALGYVLLGAVYGGTGGGCPLPTYHLLLLWVVLAGSPVYGAALLGTYVVGRIAPIVVVGAVLRGRAIDVFGGRYDRLRTVNATVLIGGGSLLVVFTAGRLLVEVIS